MYKNPQEGAFCRRYTQTPRSFDGIGDREPKAAPPLKDREPDGGVLLNL